MLNITTQNFALRYLSDNFFEKIQTTLKETLEKKTRPYCVLLVKVKGLDFALPLRSNLPEKEGVGIKTIPNPQEKGRFKGIDFSKAIIVSAEDLKTDRVILKDKAELLFIQGNDKKIQREFKKYVDQYIACVKNNKVLDSKYQFTTLVNYHKELKISVK